MNEKIVVVGGPIIQPVDAVLSLVPSGRGRLAEAIAQEFAKTFPVERLGNFVGSSCQTFAELARVFEQPLQARAIIYLPHLPNVIIAPREGKIRLEENQQGTIGLTAAPKLIRLVKKMNPQALLIPFKLAEKTDDRISLIRWMLDLKVGQMVYSRLGDSRRFWLLDALANEQEVAKEDLPAVLVREVTRLLQVVRRMSVREGEGVPPVPYIEKLVKFSRQMQPAFSQLLNERAASGRWPGNFSFRCSHGFLSHRINEGFVITRRNVDKVGLTADDFVFVEKDLRDGQLAFHGAADAKPSTDAPVHRILYEKLGWVQSIVHGHLHAVGAAVHPEFVSRWPCGAENEAEEIVSMAPAAKQSLWVVNITGHGFVALIGDVDPTQSLFALTQLTFK